MALKTVEQKTYAAVCDCGYGQGGDRGQHQASVPPGNDPEIIRARSAAREQDLKAGQRWDGKTTVTVPAGQTPTCPNCNDDYSAPTTSAAAPADDLAALRRRIAELEGRPGGAL